MVLPGVDSPPEELEELGFSYIKEGKLKEGLRLILRAAKAYEDKGRKEDAARLYRYFGYVLAKRAGKEKGKPPLLKASYLYIDLIEAEIVKPEVDVDVLDDYCSNVLEIFAFLNDGKLLTKYTREFATIYEDLGASYEENNDIKMAIRAYESAFRYYKMMDDEENYKRLAEKLITLYGQLAEEMLSKDRVSEAAEAFYELARYTRVIFGYDIHYIEMMDTAARNFEKASKLAYSFGDLDGTTSYLVKSQYSYMLARNFNRMKLIGLNTARMLYQVISAHQGSGEYGIAALKTMELAEALLGIGKVKEGLEAYKNALDLKADLSFKVRVRLAILKNYAAQKASNEILDEVDLIEYQLKKKKPAKALEIANRTMEKIGEIRDLLRILTEAEGYY
ncbi:hypothetical protein [Thermococcus sp.]|uniref:hypothetical protein n=1 Tax=Thermococcus sp. TaxID=35749 RepID=UPI002610542E|nr:hypothetical protein [Thermococcus sp.]